MNAHKKNAVRLAIVVAALITYLLPWVDTWFQDVSIWKAGSIFKELGDFSETGEATTIGIIVIISSAIAVLLLLLNGYRILKFAIDNSSDDAYRNSTSNSGFWFSLFNAVAMIIIILVVGSDAYDSLSITAWPVVNGIVCISGIFIGKSAQDDYLQTYRSKYKVRK